MTTEAYERRIMEGWMESQDFELCPRDDDEVEDEELEEDEEEDDDEEYYDDDLEDSDDEDFDE